MSDVTSSRDRPEGAGRPAVFVYGATAAASLAWLGAIFLAPALASGRPRLSAVLYALFSPICHQIPSRSFFFRGLPLAVCGRCLGIYAGALAGLAAYPFVRGFRRPPGLPPVWLLGVCSLPIGLDVAVGWTGLWASSSGLRFATGLIWGLLLPYYFVPGVTELAVRFLRRRP